jgi:hypothetical protein
MNPVDKYVFTNGILVGTVITTLVLSMFIGSFWTDNLRLKREQREWIKQGVLEYHSTTGKIVPAGCENEKIDN